MVRNNLAQRRSWSELVDPGRVGVSRATQAARPGLAGVCKKPTNRTNRPKPTEPLPNFRFGFGSVRFRFHFLKTEIFGFGFGVGFYHPKPNRTDRIYIYLCNSITYLISGLVVCYIVPLLVIPRSSLRVGAYVFLLFNSLKP